MAEHVAVGGGLWTFGESSWVERWAEVEHIGGPDRVVHDQPCPNLKRHPLRFAPPRVETDPLIWEGDNA